MEKSVGDLLRMHDLLACAEGTEESTGERRKGGRGFDFRGRTNTQGLKITEK